MKSANEAWIAWKFANDREREAWIAWTHDAVRLLAHSDVRSPDGKKWPTETFAPSFADAMLAELRRRSEGGGE